MAVQIKIDQSGKPAGVPGQAREDLALATAVVLAAIGGPFSQYQWTLVDAPPNAALTAPSSATLTTPTSSTSGLTPDNDGTYVVQLAVDAGYGLGARPEDVVRITFYAGTTLNPTINLLPRRVPSVYEQLEHNVPNPVEPTGNTKGWAFEWRKWFKVIENLSASAVNMPGAGDDWKVAFGLSLNFDYADGVRIIDNSGARDQLRFGTDPATAGTMRFTGAFQLATKISSTEYSWEFSQTGVEMPEDADQSISLRARTGTGPGYRFTLIAGGASGSNQDGGELRLQGGSNTGTGDHGFVSLYSKGTTKLAQFDNKGLHGTNLPRLQFADGGTIEAAAGIMEMRAVNNELRFASDYGSSSIRYHVFGETNHYIHSDLSCGIVHVQQASAIAGQGTYLRGQRAGAGSGGDGGWVELETGNPESGSGSAPGDLRFMLGETWWQSEDRGYAETIVAPENGIADVRSFAFHRTRRYTSTAGGDVVVWSIPVASLIPAYLKPTPDHVVIVYKWTILSWLGTGSSQTGVYWRRGTVKIWDSTGTPTMVITEMPAELAAATTLGCGLNAASTPFMVVSANQLDFHIDPYANNIRFDLHFQAIGFYHPVP